MDLNNPLVLLAAISIASNIYKLIKKRREQWTIHL